MKAVKIALVLLGIAAGSLPAAADVVSTFDGSGSYATFDSLAAAYRTLMGAAQHRIDFSDLTLGGGPIGDFYATRGVTFSNEGTAMILSEGPQVINGWYQGSLAGYGTPGMPANGALVYSKIYDDDPNSPLTIDFAAPVSSVGGYIANSAGGASSLTIRAFDAYGNPLSVVVTQVSAWGNTNNSEGWWGFQADSPEISRITILSTGNYGVASLGNLEWNLASAGSPPPLAEPATSCLILLGGVGMLRRRNARQQRAK